MMIKKIGQSAYKSVIMTMKRHGGAARDASKGIRDRQKSRWKMSTKRFLFFDDVEMRHFLFVFVYKIDSVGPSQKRPGWSSQKRPGLRQEYADANEALASISSAVSVL